MHRLILEWRTTLALFCFAVGSFSAEAVSDVVNDGVLDRTGAEQPTAAVALPIVPSRVSEVSGRYTVPAGPPETGTVLHIDTYKASLNTTNLKKMLHEAEVQMYAIPDRRVAFGGEYDCEFGPLGRKDYVRLVLEPTNKYKPPWDLVLNVIDGLKAFTADRRNAKEMRLYVFQDGFQVAIGLLGRVYGVDEVSVGDEGPVIIQRMS